MKYQALLLLFLTSSFADTVTVAVHHFSPCVRIEKGQISGFDIDILENVADKMNLSYRYEIVDNFSELLDRVRRKKVDIAVAGITITSERERAMDFSHSYLKSGLNILINKNHAPNVLSIILQYFKEAWRAILILLIFLVICAFIIWLCEHGKPSFDDRFTQGMGDGIYWVNTTMTTVGYGDKVPMTTQGKIFAMIVMWLGITCIFPYFIAQMGRSFNSLYSEYEINSPEDLRGKTVAVIKGTTSENCIEGVDKWLLRKSNHEALKDLRAGRAHAFIYDMPVLKEIVKSNDDFVIAGDMFDKQDYGFAFLQDSPLRERFNIELLRLLRSAEYQQIYDRWFK